MQTPLNSIVERFIEQARAGKVLTKAGKIYSEAAIQSYKNLMLWISLYESCTDRMCLETLDLETCDDFLYFLLESGLAQNTIASLAKRLKATLRRAWRRQQANFDVADIVAPGEVTTAVYTNLEELETMAGMIFPENLSWIRDVYLIQSFTGQRFSDVKKIILEPEKHFRIERGQFYFALKTQKTGEEVVVPVASVVREIFERRGAGAFDGKSLYYQWYNQRLKDVARISEIIQPVVLSRTVGGQRQDWTVEKCEAISSHTARRSFATNAYLAGMDLKTIAAFTGHKQLSTLELYIRCSAMEVAQQAARHPFFQDAFSIRNT